MAAASFKLLTNLLANSPHMQSLFPKSIFVAAVCFLFSIRENLNCLSRRKSICCLLANCLILKASAKLIEFCSRFPLYLAYILRFQEKKPCVIEV